MRILRAVLVVGLGLALVSVGWTLISGSHRASLPRLQVEVLNGCGESGLAQRAAQRLQGLGQAVEVVADAEHHDFAVSFLVDRRGKPQLTRRLAERIGPCRVVLERTDDASVDVTLVLGRDWPSLGLFRESVGSGPAGEFGR